MFYRLFIKIDFVCQFVKSYAALQNLITLLPNPNPMLSGQVESESEKNRLGSASLLKVNKLDIKTENELKYSMAHWPA